MGPPKYSEVRESVRQIEVLLVSMSQLSIFFAFSSILPLEIFDYVSYFCHLVFDDKLQF